MPTRSRMRARIALPDPARLSPQGRRIYESILSTRGSLEGPFLAWLHAPQLADPAEKLGAFCRYGTHLQPMESEMLILLVAKAFRCDGEWQIHAPIAARVGLDPAAIGAIGVGRRPILPTERLATLHEFASELLGTHRVSAERFERTMHMLGTEGLVEVVGLVGYYTLVAMTLNAFEMTLESDSPSTG